jgi:hypothetical protein
LDLAVGVIDYPKQIEVLTGWVHHSIYIALCMWALRAHFTGASGALFFMEMPTFLMACGRLDSRLRSDWLFGLTFFLTRVLFFACLELSFFTDRAPPVTLWPAGVPVLALHLFWFKAWISQQMRLQSKKGLEATKAKAHGA